jgi:hypothetical protein
LGYKAIYMQRGRVKHELGLIFLLKL